MAMPKLSPGWLPITWPPSGSAVPVHHSHLADVASRQRTLLRYTPEMQTVAVLNGTPTHYFRALIPADVTQFFVAFKTDADGEIDFAYNGTTYTVTVAGGDEQGDPLAQYATPLWTVAGPTVNEPTSVEITADWTPAAGTDADLYEFIIVGFKV